jgi:hypothetical protein
LINLHAWNTVVLLVFLYTLTSIIMSWYHVLSHDVIGWKQTTNKNKIVERNSFICRRGRNKSRNQ